MDRGAGSSNGESAFSRSHGSPVAARFNPGTGASLQPPDEAIAKHLLQTVLSIAQIAPRQGRDLTTCARRWGAGGRIRANGTGLGRGSTAWRPDDRRRFGTCRRVDGRRVASALPSLRNDWRGATW